MDDGRWVRSFCLGVIRKMRRFALLLVVASASCSGEAGSVDTPPDTGHGDVTIDASVDISVPPPEYPYCDVDEAAVEALWAGMTQRQRIGQRIIAGAYRAGDSLETETEVLLTDYAVSGVFIGPPEGIAVDAPETTARFVHQNKALAYETNGVPLFVCLDQEGGPNAVVNSITGGTDTIGSMPIGATGDPAVAYEQFDIMAREVSALGFNMDLGPVLDTLVTTRHGNLNTRPFGPDTELNAALGAAAVEALQMNLVLAVGKHFPGDGWSSGNTHKVHVLVDADKATMDQVLLPPFKAAIARGADGIMTIPAAYEAVDPDRSAITSRAVTTDLLKGELGFEGLVITDALGMAGAEIGLDDDESPGVEAMKAGADILLYVNFYLDDAEDLYTRIEDALDSGELDATEFEAGVKRVLRMKQRYCLFEDPTKPDEADIKTLSEHIALPGDRATSRAHADRAVVLLQDDGVLPLTDERILYVGPDTIFSDPGSGWVNIVDQTFGDALTAAGADVNQVTSFLPMNPSLVFSQVMDRVDESDIIVVGTLQGRFSLDQQQLLEWLLEESGLPLVHVILGVPFDYAQSRDRAAATVALMGSRSVMVEAGAAVILGLQEAEGTMLFDLDSVSADGVTGGPDDPGAGEDRCEEQEIDCSGGGICVDTGVAFGCVCQPNWHPAADGLDCEPDL